VTSVLKQVNCFKIQGVFRVIKASMQVQIVYAQIAINHAVKFATLYLAVLIARAFMI